VASDSDQSKFMAIMANPHNDGMAMGENNVVYDVSRTSRAHGD
jgi:hypothetical protein